MRGSAAGTWMFSRVFGSGFIADVAARGVTYLGEEVREALSGEDQAVTKVRLRPGETYTVIARPKATRRERRLARKQSRLLRAFEIGSRPTGAQQRVGRRLRRAQRRLDRARPGSRRYKRRFAKEQKLGLRFDRIMRPSRKQIRTAEELDRVSKQLNGLRDAHFRAARAAHKPRRRVTIYN